MKRIIHILLLLCVTQWAVAEQDHIPTRNVEITDDGVIVTYEFHGGIHQQAPLYPNAKFWKIPEFGLNDVVGEPAYPLRWDTFAVPNGTTASVEIIDSVYSDTTFTLSPAYPPLVNSDDTYYTTDVVLPITAYTGFYPRHLTALDKVQYYRGQGLVRVGIMPIQYNMKSHKIRAYSRIQYKLTFTKINGLKVHGEVKSTENSSYVSVTDNFIKNIALNYSTQIETKTQSNQDASLDTRRYLIITVDTLLNEVNAFAKWKRTKGFNVIVESRHQWYNDTTFVKGIVTQHYLQDSIQYLLIVGDINDVPAPIRDFEYNNDGTIEHYTHATDIYYRMMDNDNIPDIYAGRIPTSKPVEAEIIFQKIINYEKNPVMDSNFYKTALHCAYFQDKGYYQNNVWINTPDGKEDRKFASTSEEIKEYVKQHGKHIEYVYKAPSNVSPQYWYDGSVVPDSLRRGHFNWSGNAQNIKDSINDGVFYVLHRDHGSRKEWSMPNFSTTNIDLLQNGAKLPVVFSMNCLTGRYDLTNDDCFAERFLKKENGGCVAIYAATRQSFSPHNDYMSKEMFKSIWPQTGQNYACYELGEILHSGIQKYWNNNYNPNYNNFRYCIYTQEIFHCFGDPSMMMYTEKPKTFSNPEIIKTDSTIEVLVNDGEARITFYNRRTQQVDSYWGTHIIYPTNNEYNFVVCLDRHNYIPYLRQYSLAYIQNEIVNTNRIYTEGETLKIGRQVTNQITQGNVLINANIKVEGGGSIELHPGTMVNKGELSVEE